MNKANGIWNMTCLEQIDKYTIQIVMIPFCEKGEVFKLDHN